MYCLFYVALCIVCVYMCTVLLPPGGYPIAVKYISYHDDKSTAMLVSRRKRNEIKEINVFLNYKLLKQVNQIKYLGIIMDNKFKFREHITYAAEKCTKIIYSLSKSAKITWGLRHEVLKIIYEGAILPLLLYGAPVWIDAM